MALARWQRTITDESGNVVPSANIEVRREIAGAPLVQLYSDRDGMVAIGNPFQADAEGFAAFHVVGGAYRIRAYADGFERIWRYVAIGTNAESDFGAGLLPRGEWDSGTTYALRDVVSKRVGDAVYAFASNEDSNLNNEPQFETGDVPESDTHWTALGLIPGEGGNVSSLTVLHIEKLTEAEYDLLTPDANTLYVIIEEE